MKTEDIAWDKYDTPSLDFILLNAETILSESFTSFREAINKSYIALTIYTGALVYFLNRISVEGVTNNNYYLLIGGVGSIVSIALLFTTLLPCKITFPGFLPENIMDDSLESFEGEKMLYIKAQTIVDRNNSTKSNMEKVYLILQSFKRAAIAFVLTIFFTLLTYGFIIAKGCEC